MIDLQAVHRGLGLVAAASVVAVLLASVGLAVLGSGWRVLVDRLILAALAAVSLAIVGGIGLLLGGGRPADPLHFLYGVAALVTLPVAQGLGRRDRGRRRPWWRRQAAAVLLGSLVMLGILARLFMTGG